MIIPESNIDKCTTVSTLIKGVHSLIMMLSNSGNNNHGLEDQGKTVSPAFDEFSVGITQTGSGKPKRERDQTI